MTFRVLDQSIDLIHALRGVVLRLDRTDRDLAKQLRRAATSIALNLGESQGRAGKDRVHFVRVALGSAEEVRTALRVAVAWGHVQSAQAQPCLAHLDGVVAVLFKLTR